MKPRPPGSSEAPSAETRVYSITFRIPAAPPDPAARHRHVLSLSLEVDPGGPETGRPRTAQFASPAGSVPVGTVRNAEGEPCEVTAGPADLGPGWRRRGVPPAHRAVPAPLA